jgi:hypothetical protein
MKELPTAAVTRLSGRGKDKKEMDFLSLITNKKTLSAVHSNKKYSDPGRSD